MFLVEIFIPRSVLEAEPNRKQVEQLKVEFTNKFGGVTSYLRASADGLWVNGEGKIERDEIGVLEVMVEKIDKDWWRQLRKRLEMDMKQEQILIRSRAVELL